MGILSQILDLESILVSYTLDLSARNNVIHIMVDLDYDDIDNSIVLSKLNIYCYNACSAHGYLQLKMNSVRCAEKL